MGSEEISKGKYQSKHKLFQKQATNCYIQNQFDNYIEHEDELLYKIQNKLIKKERYSNLENCEVGKAISKVRFSLNESAIITGKCYKIEK